MTETIYYFVLSDKQKFKFFEDYKKAKKFRNSLPRVEKNILGNTFEGPKYEMEQKDLKHYYGTVFLGVKWGKNGNCSYVILGRWKEAKHYRDDYNIEKFVLTPYEEYKRQNTPEPEEVPLEEATKEAKDKADMINRSPF
jgi:hypothetical protein